MTKRHLGFHPAILLSFTLFSNAQAAAVFECLIEPTQTIDIKSPVTGLLNKVTVQRGEVVHKGQDLAYLESKAETTATELARFKAEMQAATATAENKIDYAKRKYQRRKDMQSKNFGSVQDLDEAESELKLAESQLDQAQENKTLAKLEWKHQQSLLDLRTIRSPIDGIVVEQNVFPGEVVEPGGKKENILKLAQIDPLRVSVILPIAAFGKVKTGMRVGVTPEAPINGKYHAKVKIIDRVVDAASGTFSVFLEMPNPDFSVPAGVKCKAAFPFGLAAGKGQP